MSLLLTTKLSTEEIFNFNVSELVVTEEGNLFKGYNLYKSVRNARNFVIKGIMESSNIGKGHNPLNHFL